MSEETKKKESELEDKDLEQVAGGVDNASPKFNELKIKLTEIIPDKPV